MEKSQVIITKGADGTGTSLAINKLSLNEALLLVEIAKAQIMESIMEGLGSKTVQRSTKPFSQGDIDNYHSGTHHN